MRTMFIKNYSNIGFGASKLSTEIRPTWQSKLSVAPKDELFVFSPEESDEICRRSFLLQQSILENLNKKDEFVAPVNNTRLSFREKRILNCLKTGEKDFLYNDYYKLSNDAKKLARCYCQKLRSMVDDTLNYADLLKINLDEYYGQDNYTIVSIGRSPATIARCFDRRGLSVIYCPISGFREDDIERFRGTKAYEVYLDFLQNQGLNNVNLNQSDKKMIVYDYTETASSLKAFRDLLVDDLNLPKDKIIIRSINQDLEDIASDKDKVLGFINNTFRLNESQLYGGIPQLHWSFADEVKKLKLSQDEKLGFNQFKFLLQDKIANEK